MKTQLKTSQNKYQKYFQIKDVKNSYSSQLPLSKKMKITNFILKSKYRVKSCKKI